MAKPWLGSSVREHRRGALRASFAEDVLGTGHNELAQCNSAEDVALKLKALRLRRDGTTYLAMNPAASGNAGATALVASDAISGWRLAPWPTVAANTSHPTSTSHHPIASTGCKGQAMSVCGVQTLLLS